MKPKSLLAGLVAGAALGIFFAPKKGKEVRDNLKDDVKAGNTGLSVLKKTILEMGKEMGEYCKENLPEEKIEEKIKDTKKVLKKTKKDAEKKIKKTVKKAKKLLS